MLDCVVIKEFLDDLESNKTIDLFYISFGGSTVPLSQFTSRDYMRDLAKTGASSTPTVIDNGWEVTVKFQYTELRKFTKVYLLYAVNNQYKLAYIFDASDLQVFTNFIKLDFSDFACNAYIRTNHKNDNIIYSHRHTEANGGNDDIDRAPPQQDLMETISGLPQITSAGMNFITVSDFGLTDKESRVSIDEAFVNHLMPDKKTLGVNFINSYLIEYDMSANDGMPLEDLDIVTISGSGFDCDVYCTDLNAEFKDESQRIGSLKFFPTIDHFEQYSGTYLACDGKEVDEKMYPEYIRLFGKIFNNRTPDLMNGYIRSSGFIDPITKDGYPICSQNQAQVKAHNHIYTPSHIRSKSAGRLGVIDGGSHKNVGNINFISTVDGSDSMVAKSFIGIWGIKAR